MKDKKIKRRNVTRPGVRRVASNITSIKQPVSRKTRIRFLRTPARPGGR